MSHQPPEQLSESEYLDQEIELARRAMTDMRARLKHDVRRLADPRIWIRSYPLASVIAACTTGVLVAPRRRKVCEAVEGQPGLVAEVEPQKSSWTAPVWRELWAALRKALISTATSGLMGRTANLFQSFATGNVDGEYGEEQVDEQAEAGAGADI